MDQIYREEGLTLWQRRRRRRRVAGRPLEVLPDGTESSGSMDSIADQLPDGKMFRSLTALDIYTRDCPDARGFTTLTETR